MVGNTDNLMSGASQSYIWGPASSIDANMIQNPQETEPKYD